MKFIHLLQLTQSLYTWLKIVSLFYMTLDRRKFHRRSGMLQHNFDSPNQPESGNSIYPHTYFKKTRLIYLSWIRLWSPLRACTYLLGCEKRLFFGFNFWDGYWGLGWRSTSFIFIHFARLASKYLSLSQAIAFAIVRGF